MNRLLPKLILYSFACHYFVAFAASVPSRASTPDQDKHPVKSQQKTVNHTSVNQITITGKSNNNFILVPPPPPEQPSFLDWSGITGLSTSWDLFNKEELKQRLIHIQKQIVNAQRHVEENKTQLVEAKDKAQRFGSLYTEGVVSHRELEAAEKNALDKESSAQEAQGKLADLQMQEKAIQRRLIVQKKSPKNIKHISKSKVAKNEKQ